MILMIPIKFGLLVLGLDVEKCLKADETLSKLNKRQDLVIIGVEKLCRTHHNKNLALLNFWKYIFIPGRPVGPAKLFFQSVFL